jgi:uncharacterized protein (DUF1501 family)
MTLPRRAFLHGLACLPAALPALAHAAGAPHAPGPRRRRQRALIVVWLDGGMSHLDTFDGKPDAPAEVRGDLASIRGALDGTFVSAALPRLAARLDRCALLRSVTHGEGNHDRGSHLLLTGHRPSPVLVHPSLGAVLAHDASDGAPALPAYVAIPEGVAYAGAGFLQATRAPFATGGDPGQGTFAVRDATGDARGDRVDALRERLDALDGPPRGRRAEERARFAARAARLSRGDEARRWFDLANEPAERRARFGRHRLGQSCLLARRLVQGGVRTVLVTDPGWDHHRRIATELTYGFPGKLPALDEALAALLDDLRELELEDDVVVAVASEFGRTPRLNPSGGRDHWPRAQCVLLAGGGIRPGVVGATDARGEEPIERPLAPEDVFATLAAAVGLEPDLVLQTPDGRPVRLVADGAAPIAEVLV